MKKELEERKETDVKVQVSRYEVKKRLREMAHERGELDLEDLKELACHYAEQTDSKSEELLVVIISLNRERVVEGLDELEKRADQVIGTGVSGLTPAHPNEEESPGE